MPGHRVANSCCTPGRCPAILMMATRWAPSSKPLRGSPAARSSGSGSFDPETLVILETAFDEAWITLKTNGSGNIRPDELARRICHLHMKGERDPVRLHDRALGELVPAATWRELR